MKKLSKALIIILFVGMGIKTKAQSFEQGANVISAALGFGSGLYSGTGYSSGLAVGLAYEHCVVDGLIDGNAAIGVGGYMGFASSKYSATFFGQSFGYKYTYWVPAVRGAFHYEFLESLDTYGGLALGANIVTGKETGIGNNAAYTADASGFYFSIYVGGRYYFTENLGAMVEIGSGVSYFNLGVCYTFY